MFVNEDAESLSSEVSSIILPAGSNAADIDMAAAVSEFRRYVGVFDADDPSVRWKLTHSLRVAQWANVLGMDAVERGCGVDVGLVSLAGLLHDIGRFPQLALQGSFDDRLGCDHGVLGHSLLMVFGGINRYIVGDGLSDKRTRWHVSMAMDAIRQHNAFAIERGSGEVARDYVSCVKEADIIDIFDILGYAVNRPNERRCSSKAATDAVMASVESGSLVRFGMIRNDTDRFISKVAFAFAAHSGKAKEILLERRGYAEYAVSKELEGAAADDMARAVAAVDAYLSAR